MARAPALARRRSGTRCACSTGRGARGLQGCGAAKSEDPEASRAGRNPFSFPYYCIYLHETMNVK